MKFLPILAFFLFFGIQPAEAQTRNKDFVAYIIQYGEWAMAEQQRTGIPAAIKMAQGILESGAGKGSLVQRSNNHFGIKCKSTWTGLTAYHDDDAKDECFRAYPSAQESYEDHSNFLKNGLRYAFLFDIPVTDYKGWAEGLRKAGYATNPKYAAILCRVIETYNLYELTEFASSGRFLHEDWAALLQDSYHQAPNIAAAAKIETVSKIAVISQPVQNPELAKTTEDTRIKIVPYQVLSMNNLNAVYIPENSSWSILSAKLNIPVENILKFNDLLADAEPVPGKLVYLQEKNDQAPVKSYKTKKEESLWSVSQYLGIKLEKLAHLNHIPVLDLLPAGTTIILP